MDKLSSSLLLFIPHFSVHYELVYGSHIVLSRIRIGRCASHPLASLKVDFT